MLLLLRMLLPRIIRWLCNGNKTEAAAGEGNQAVLLQSSELWTAINLRDNYKHNWQCVMSPHWWVVGILIRRRRRRWQKKPFFSKFKVLLRRLNPFPFHKTFDSPSFWKCPILMRPSPCSWWGWGPGICPDVPDRIVPKHLPQPPRPDQLCIWRAESPAQSPGPRQAPADWGTGSWKGTGGVISWLINFLCGFFSLIFVNIWRCMRLVISGFCCISWFLCG